MRGWPATLQHGSVTVRPLHRRDARAWWRCVVRGLGFGSVTGYIQLGAMITSYEVLADDGARVYRAPAELERADPLAGREYLIRLATVRP